MSSVKCVVALGTVLGLFLTRTAAAGPSVCLVTQEGCLTPGGIEVRVQMGLAEEEVVGGQFVIQYDPSVLQLIDAAPGRTCDPASPFGLEISQSNNPTTGEVFYAVGVSFLKGMDGTIGPATLACLSFAPATNADAATDVCLAEGSTTANRLVNRDGQPVPIDNSVDCPAAAPMLACDEVLLQAHCTCVPDTEDCHAFDTECRLGVCNPATELCEIASINEDGTCDDGDPCTPLSRCRGGQCVGEGCQTSSLCPQSASCLGLDSTLQVVVMLTPGDRPIRGAQFSVLYDSTELQLVEVLPGQECDPSSPFSTPLSQVVDEAAGKVFYAVGVSLGASGTTGPAALACLHFLDLGDPGGDACMFEDQNPFTTVLADEFGQAVSPGSITVCPLVEGEPPAPCTLFETCRIPAVSAWGIAVLTLLLLIGAKVAFGLTRHAEAP